MSSVEPMTAPAPAALPSRYLPRDFAVSRPVALLAGKGVYPRLAVEAMQAAGVPVRLVAFTGETEAELIARFPEAQRAEVKVGQLGKLLRVLRELEAGYVLMAGQITPGRLFRGLHPDLKAVRMLAGLKARNAETIFGAISDEIAATGIEVLDARAFMDDHIAAAGLLTPGRARLDRAEIARGAHLVKELARLDIGQGLVLRRGTVIAVEAFEGTDAMLRRAGDIGGAGAVFFKASKPSQDFRFDVPVVGLRTLATLRTAGIRHVCVEAEHTLLLEKELLLERARQESIQVYGFDT